MKLENQVVSLPLAQRLKELGVKQESLFWWHDGCSTWATPHIKSEAHSCIGHTFSAFTVAELGQLLVDVKHNYMSYFCDQPQEMCWVYNFGPYPEYVKGDTEADARAAMLIHLIENNLIQNKP